LNEARARWNASKAVDTVLDYSGALSAAGHYDTIIRDILPLYSGDIDQDADVDLIFALTTVADALARKGRWQDIEALYARAEKIWPLTWNANAVNVTANRGRYLLLAGRPADALRYLDLSLAEGLRWQVNHSAIATMHHYRACTLHELGRNDRGRSLSGSSSRRPEYGGRGRHSSMYGKRESGPASAPRGTQEPH
jgi:tetratricopeptide (TPR) repeat protein